MKKGFSRILCALLVMLLCLGQLVGIAPVQAATTVNYRYGSASGFSNVIYNWGTRGETADFLSPNAEKFYDTYTSYEELSQLSGSSSVSSLNTSALFKQLRSMVTNAQKKTTSYNDTRDLYQFTDCQNSALTSNKISSFYSGVAIGPSWDGGSTWNREHTWPNSKGDANGNGENDIMMLRPASVSENSSRGNKAYGTTTSSNYYNPNDKSGGNYDLRGDVARIMLYVYVRWSTAQPSVMFGTDGVIESKDVLLDWMEADPVDTWELGRNDSVQSITGTRNVFVDYPELAFLLFNEEIPSDMTTPSGNATPAYTVTASSNNTAYGTVAVSGRTITATPKAGYQVSGYTVLSGNATVTRSGNTFTVTATGDCSIRINFEPRTVYTATFTENGVTTASDSSYDTITLPNYTAEPTDGYSFGGWVTGEVEETNNRPSPVYTPGSTYTLTSNTTFHALYYIRTEEGASDDTFVLYSGEITDGDYLITYNAGALTASVNSGTRLDYTSITATDDAVVTENAAIVWNVTKQADGYYTIYNASTGMYAAGNGTKNKAALLASVTDYAKWIATGDTTYEFENLGNKNAGVNAMLRRNNTYGFATYSTTTGGALTLYKRGSGSTLAPTSLPGQPAYTVTFADYDGTVISSETYFEGDTVTVPANPTRPADDEYTYEFAGWTPAVTAVTGDATYTATYTATKIVVENAIIAQPQDVAVDSGATVQFHVEAQGDVISYKWEYRQIYKWFNTSMTGYNTDTLTVDATGARNGYDYRCVVTFADGTVITSDMAELTVKTEITNVGNPNDQVVVNGYKGQFTASATGEGLKYRWYYQRPDGTIWSETAMEGCERPTVFIESTAARDGYKYKCKITDVTGNVVYTEVATMRVLTFKSHPQNTTGSVGDNVTFTVTTSVDTGFTYQWQYSKDGVKWSNTTMAGYNTDTLTVPVTAARNGYEYRCVLTGSKNSKIESKAAVLTVTEPVKVTAQPENVTCSVGEAAIFTVDADNVASYQWQYQSATNTTRWSNTGATGNKTATLSITATTGNNGYKYRCVITGIDGNQYITEVATLTVN